MKPFQSECCLDDETLLEPCEEDRIRTRLTVQTEASNKTSVWAVSDIFQHGQQVHAIRLEVVDEDGQTAILTLAPAQLQQAAEWLNEQASKLIPAGGSGE